MKLKKKVLVITGGLGNQLFQLAAGLTAASPDDLIIDRNLGAPRLNRTGCPDLDSFLFPIQLNFNSENKWKLVLSKIGLLAFKISSKRFSGSRVQRIWICLKDKASIFGVYLSDGVGFDPRTRREMKSKWIFGPFHTYKYVQDDSVNKFMSAMVPRDYPDWLAQLRIFAAEEKPIVLHIRLSDYKYVKELGILRPDYFKRCLGLALSQFPDSHVWLFTDEEDLALRILGDHSPQKMRIINYDLGDSASNLEAMRFGKCYVLSNSTFSWWGAYLSYSRNPKIYCPENWFRELENPLNLIPSDWEKVKN